MVTNQAALTLSLPLQALVVGVGGALGALARHALTVLVLRVQGDPFPLATLLVNVLGCLALGVVAALADEGRLLSPGARLFLTVGLLGSLTTFSTFSYETLDLVRAGQTHLALANAAASLALGLGAVVAGRALARALLPG